MPLAIMFAPPTRASLSARRLTRRLRWLWVLALLLALGMLARPAAAAKQQRNDTGQTLCIDPGSSAPIACPGSGQDGESGRDMSQPGSKDGAAGFSFVKIAADGTPLPRQAGQWSCVLDRVTGLMWEVKSDDEGLRDKDRLYRNWGGGQGNEANAFVRAVNAEGLCSHHDWRLPGREELMGLLDFGRASDQPGIDTDWFPNTVAGMYWTGTISADPLGAWSADLVGRFVNVRHRKEALSVRLVRDQR